MLVCLKWYFLVIYHCTFVTSTDIMPLHMGHIYQHRDQSSYAPSQWETLLQCNNVSHWLGAYLDWSLGRRWLTRLLTWDIWYWSQYGFVRLSLWLPNRGNEGLDDVDICSLPKGWQGTIDETQRWKMIIQRFNITNERWSQIQDTILI